MVKRILLGIGLLLLTVIVGCCQESEEPLQRFDKSSPLTLTIKSDKQVYEVGDSIYVYYKITNTGDKEIAIAQPFSDNGVIDPHVFGGSFIIKDALDEDLTEVFPLALINWGIPNKPLTLRKGESYMRKVNIVKIEEDDNLKHVPYSSEMNLQREDKYKIIGRYEWLELRKDYPSPNCWKGILTSNTITIKVIEKK